MSVGKANALRLKGSFWGAEVAVVLRGVFLGAIQQETCTATEAVMNGEM